MRYVLWRNALVCFCCRVLVLNCNERDKFKCRDQRKLLTGLNEGPVSQNASKLIKHNISRLSIITEFPVYCCRRCICNARPLAHPVRWSSVSESRPAADHPYEGKTCSATAAASKPRYVRATAGHARFRPWRPAHRRPAGEEGPACHRAALISEQRANNQSTE